MTVTNTDEEFSRESVQKMATATATKQDNDFDIHQNAKQTNVYL